MKRVRRNRLKKARRELPKLPPLPRFSIDLRTPLVAAGAIAVVAMSFGIARQLLEIPVRHLEIEGSFQRVSKLEIEAAVSGAGTGSIMTLDLNDMHRRIAAIDWVDSVVLKRDWPDTLRISVVEHRAAARWGESGLLNVRGELFAEDVQRQYRELPMLAGPEGSHRRVASRYLEVRERLADTQLTLEAIRMDARGAFTIEFVGGLVVRIGRTDVSARIQRFFDVAARELSVELGRVAYVDMRYPNGFAVGWRDQDSGGTRLARLDDDG